MIISKATGTWGDGADEATFNLEVVGNTPAEVMHLGSLVSEPTTLNAVFEDGALKISLSFERRVSLVDQAAQKAAADAKAAKDAQTAADAKAKAEQAQADEDQKEMHDTIAERAAQIVADRIAPKA